jgi:hypothetical protein
MPESIRAARTDFLSESRRQTKCPPHHPPKFTAPATLRFGLFSRFGRTTRKNNPRRANAAFPDFPSSQIFS